MIRIATLAVLIATSTPATADESIALGARSPSPTVISMTGVNTAKAKVVAKLTKADFARCENDDGLACSTYGVRPGQIFKLTANCVSGSIVDETGAHFRRDGSWSEDDLFAGRPRFKDSRKNRVSTDNASAGGALAVNYEMLCPSDASR